MANIDDRVVSMSFESTKFQQGISTSMTSLDKFNASLKKIGIDNGLDKIEKSANKISFSGLGTAIDKIKGKFGRGFPEADQAFSEVEKGSGKVTLNPIATAIDKLKGRFNFPEADQGFSGIEKASGKVTFSGLTQALDNLGNKFGVLQGVASVALGNISSQAIMRGSNFVKSFSFGPIVDGFKEYGTQLNAVQTILANTDGQRVSGLKNVNKALNNLNHYADKTIYNFTEMAKNIGTFTAAGVDLNTATASIKGIANLAAVSGSNSQQASTAMYQLSQAISAGRVGLQDWNSVVNAGMGGAVFQKALERTAVNMGSIEKGALKVDKATGKATINGESFRNSIMAKPGQESWLTGDVLTNTLKQLSGDMTDAQLKAEGFSDAQIKAIQHQAKMAVNAATQVKTLQGLLDTVKEAIGSGWAQTWQIVFGNFGEAKTLFTGLSNAIGGMVGASSKARNTLLKTWKDLGGRAFLIDTLKEAFRNLMNILQPIKIAFRDIFPKKTAGDLLQMTTNFRKLVDQFKIGPETAFNLRRTFAGFFAVLDIGKQILGGFFTIIKTVFSEVKKGSGGFLHFTGNLGDALVAFDEWLKKGEVLKNFFKGIGKMLSVPIKLLSTFGEKLTGAFSGLSGSDSGDGMAKSLQKVTGVGDRVLKVLTKIFGIWYNLSGLIYAAVSPAVSKLVDLFRDLGSVLGKAITQNNFDNFFKVLQTTLIGGIFITLKKAITGGISVGLTKPLSGVKDVLGAMTGSLKSMQTAIKAHALVQIAIAVGLIAASAVALSLVKPEKLASAMTAIGAGFGELLGTMAILSKVGSLSVNAPIIASGFVIMAGSMVILTLAIKSLSKLSWEDLGKGMAGVGAGLAILVGASKALAKIGPGLPAAGFGLMTIATALVIMSVAVRSFAKMDWAQLGKGLAGVTASLVIVQRIGRKMPVGLAGVGGGLILIAAGLTAMAAPIRIFAAMDWGTMGKGLLGIGGALVVLSKALASPTFSKQLIPIGAGLILVGIGLTTISAAVMVMGNMDIGTLGKGLGALGIALYGLSKGLMAMEKAGPGALALLAASAAFLIAAGAIAILVPTLAILGNMKFTTILKALGFLALALGILGAVGVVAAAPLALLGLGVAALGLGIMGVGKGVEALAKAIILLGDDGAKGVGVLIATFTAFIAVIPKVIIDFVKGLVGVGQEVVKLIPIVGETLTKLTIMFVDVLIKAIPKVAEAIGKLIVAVVGILNTHSGPLIEAGFKLLSNILHGISNHIVDIVKTAGTIIAKFLNSLAAKAPAIINAGANLLVKFAAGMVNNMGRIVASVASMIVKFLSSLASHIPKIVAAGANLLAKFLVGIANNLGKVLSGAVDVIAKFILGIANNLHKILDAGVSLAAKFIKGVAKGALKLIGAAFDAAMTFVHGIAQFLREKPTELANAGVDLASGLIEGIIKGLAALPGILVGKIGDLIKDAVNSLLGDEMPGKFQEFMRQHPKVFKGAGFRMGAGVVDGMTEGTKHGLTAWGQGLATGMDNVISGLKTATLAEPKVLRDIGKNLGQGFIDSLIGIERTTDRVTATIQNMDKQVRDAIKTTNTESKAAEDHINRMKKANKDMKKERGDLIADRVLAKKERDALKAKDDRTKKEDDRLTHLNKTITNQTTTIDTLKAKRDKNTQSIADETAQIKHNNEMVNNLNATHIKLTKGMEEQKGKLIALAGLYDDYTKRIEDAKQAEQDLIRIREDFANSKRDSYSALPGLVDPTDAKHRPVSQLAAYVKSLEEQTKATEEYRIVLQKLRDMKLDDATYTKLVEDGIVDKKFAEEILAGGQAAVDNLNAIDSRLGTAAKGLGWDAASALYDAGVNSAHAFVTGLETDRGKIVELMTGIGKDMITAIKTQLGIKSPSRVFMEFGKFTNQGLIKGLRDSSGAVATAASDVGDGAMTAMQEAMSRVSDVMDSTIDMNPTIRPVLDLTQFHKDARAMGIVTDGVSAAQAFAIGAMQVDKSSSDENIPGGGAKVLNFEQNNYSPKALSEAEIYRQTHNQLSQAKKAVGLR